MRKHQLKRSQALFIVTCLLLGVFFAFVILNAPPNHALAQLPLPFKVYLPAVSGNRTIALGVFLPHSTGESLATELSCFEDKVGKNHGLVLVFSAWKEDGNWKPLPESSIQAILDHNATPVVSWEPWGGTSDTGVSLIEIGNGDHDNYIRQFAQQAKDFGHPILIRWAHEMNGNWYPWSGSNNGQNGSAYIAAWQHIHQIFEDEGATNLQWVWSPNNESVPVNESWNEYGEYYPGDDYVDWIGVSGYNRGDFECWTTDTICRSFDDLFETFLDQMTNDYPDKPQLITEFAAVCNNGCDSPNDKASWITTTYIQMRNYPNLRGVIWFNEQKKEYGGGDPGCVDGRWTDYRIWCSAPCEAIFNDNLERYKTAIADSAFSSSPLVQ